MISLKTKNKIFNIAWGFLAWGLLIIGAIVILAPFIWMILSSFKSEEELLTFPPIWWPQIFKIENYQLAFEKIHFWRTFTNTVIITTGSIAGQVFSAALVGYGFARFQFRGKNALFILLLSTMMLPGQVTMIPIFVLFKQLGWIDSFKPLIVPSFFGGSAFFIFLFRQFFLGVPRDIEEAAKIDGCSFMQIFLRIILPLSKPVIMTVAIFTFMGSWNDFMGPLIYLNSTENYTLALALNEFRGAHGPRYLAQIMAISVVMIVPCLLLFFVLQRFFVKSLALTGIKG